jgi:hypothetical protein
MQTYRKDTTRLADSSRLLPASCRRTEFGKLAVDGYARYIGMSTKDFIRAMASPPTQSDVANAVVELAADARISPRERCSSLPGRGSKGPPYVKW